MRKLLVIVLSLSLLFTSCGLNSSKIKEEIPKKDTEIDTKNNTYSNNKRDNSYVENLAVQKANEIGMFDVDEPEAIKLAYDYLITNIYFADPIGLDSWRYLSDEEQPIPFIENRSLSPLLYNLGSCEDFAAVLKMLLEARGLEAKYVAGYTLSKEQVYIDHAWVIVKLDGNWYHLDPQLEQNIILNGKLRYRFFMKTDEEMLQDHKWGENLVEYWPNMPEYEKEIILKDYTYPACNTEYKQVEPKQVKLPPRADFAKLQNDIDNLRKTKQLEDIFLDVEPPILVAEYHVTPPLTLLRQSDDEQANEMYGRSTLDIKQKILYDDMYLKLKNFDISPLIVDIALSPNDIGYTVNQLINDNPEFYWAYISLENRSNILNIKYKNGYNKQLVVGQLAEIKAFAEEHFSYAKNLPDYEKALMVHDYLAENVVYDGGFKDTDSDNFYGAIIDNVAYCEGYTRAFQYLANYIGLENIYVSGWSEKSIKHAWNQVKLDGSWYYIDVTWDRFSNSYGGAYHNYFAMTEEECYSRRIWDDEQYTKLPVSNSTEDNFYYKQGYIVDLNNGAKAYEQIQNIAEIANTQLANMNNIKKDYSYSFVEFKIVGNRQEYQRFKSSFTKDLFAVLKEMQTQAEEKNLGFDVSYDSEVSCYYDDYLQVVSFYPKVKKI